ncbi:MAG: HD domain-containing phosphohydrolase [Chloroflexota bacterium]
MNNLHAPEHDHEQEHKELALLYELGQAFHATLELEPLIRTILVRALDLMQAESSAAWLLSDDGEWLTCNYVAEPAYEKLVGSSLKRGEGIAGWVAETQTPAIVNDVHADSRWASRFDALLGITTRNTIAVPLVAGGRTLGVLSLINKRSNHAAFDYADLDTLTRVAGLASVSVHNAQLYERERRRREQNELHQRVSSLLHETLDLDRLLHQVFEQVKSLLHAEGASVWLVDERLGVVVCHIATGAKADQLRQMAVPLGQGIVGAAVAQAETIFVADARSDPRVYRSVDTATGFVTRSLLTVPLLHQGRCLGAIQVVNKHEEDGNFTKGDQDLLEQLADSAALAIENAQLYAQLQQNYEGTLDALAGALDLRDNETQGHSRRVTEYTLLLAQEVGLAADELDDVRRGALLHDLGKIGVPDRILHKPGPLDADERKDMERHPSLGFEMLAGIPFLAVAAEVVLCHQERYDGRGYPRGLSGEAIPLAARLFAVADTYDAITSDRPYRAARPYAAARAEILKESGKQFDPIAVEAFLSTPKEWWLAIREKVNAEVVARRELMQKLAEEQMGEA